MSFHLHLAAVTNTELVDGSFPSLGPCCIQHLLSKAQGNPPHHAFLCWCLELSPSCFCPPSCYLFFWRSLLHLTFH